ncbi:hypothetical protein [Paenibacillus odorifer]|uniref:Uncharacterized protein n=1 Tax=Paenibacillus odorifer TaxID=189426 RepID=A0A1R0WSK8_9BACL|nr:hypothetical protein [Paenibacillus odorifer]OMD20345.1 hypothetical protein BJP51_09690 [Paenibacillus odorifer]
MKRLLSFLKNNGYEYKHINTITKSHYGGRSFYNDGYYREDVYEIKKDDLLYYLQYKSTGRAQYLLCGDDNETNVLLFTFSQKDFIDQFKSKYISEI